MKIRINRENLPDGLLSAKKDKITRLLDRILLEAKCSRLDEEEERYQAILNLINDLNYN